MVSVDITTGFIVFMLVSSAHARYTDEQLTSAAEWARPRRLQLKLELVGDGDLIFNAVRGAAKCRLEAR